MGLCDFGFLAFTTPVVLLVTTGYHSPVVVGPYSWAICILREVFGLSEIDREIDRRKGLTP